MDINKLRQIQRIEHSNNKLITRARYLHDIVSSIVSKDINALYPKDSIKKIDEILFSILSRVRESIVSLNYIHRFFIYDNMESSKNTYFKNSLYVSDNIPEFLTCGQTLSFDAEFKNTGVFYSWNDDKNIKLRLDIIRSDGSGYDPEYAVLDTTILQNIPGDESKSLDYNRIKLFHLESVVDFPAGIYDLTIKIVDTSNLAESYNCQNTKQVIVRNEV